jgi:hypothetical protein
VFDDLRAIIEKTRSTVVQAAFSDAPGSDLVYDQIEADSDTDLLYNVAHFARTGGTTQTAQDPTSRAVYQDRPYPRLNLVNDDDDDVQALADWWIAQYKDPEYRISSIGFDPHAKLATLGPEALDREVRDLVTVVRTLDTYTIEAECHIASISHSLDFRGNWYVRYGLFSALPYTRVGFWDDPESLWDESTWYIG